MNIHNNSQLLEQLAGAYALGILRGGARRRFESLARNHSAYAGAAHAWQVRLSLIHELQTPVQPGPNVWLQIEKRLKTEQQKVLTQLPTAALPASLTNVMRAPENTVSTSISHWWNGLNFWRGMGVAGAFATLAAVLVGAQMYSRLSGEVQSLSAKLANTPEIAYVAVLQDDKAAASMLVTFDPKHNRLVLKRLGTYREQPDKSLELWALPPGVAPQSLGVMGNEAIVRLAADRKGMAQVPTLAITLEPKGGVPPGTGPTGPVLFKGALIQTPQP